MPLKRELDDGETKPGPSKKRKRDAAAGDSGPQNLDFSSNAKTKGGEMWTKKFISMNVNGFRAWLKKGGMDYVKKECADIYCLQEIKCSTKDIPADDLKKAGYYSHVLPAEKPGYSGVAIIYKEQPLKITDGIGIAKHNNEGRVITSEFDDFFLVTAYVPNSGAGLKRLEYRTKEWDTDFRDYLVKLDQQKPVILCGDLNVAHKEIDLKNPKSNKNKTPGFCDSEREGLTELLNAGFIDTYRHMYPEEKDAYTFWSFMGGARARNVGWRLDYFLVSKRLEDKLCDSFMRTKVMGSDHCPIGLLAKL